MGECKVFGDPHLCPQEHRLHGNEPPSPPLWLLTVHGAQWLQVPTSGVHHLRRGRSCGVGPLGEGVSSPSRGRE